MHADFLLAMNSVSTRVQRRNARSSYWPQSHCCIARSARTTSDGESLLCKSPHVQVKKLETKPWFFSPCSGSLTGNTCTSEYLVEPKGQKKEDRTYNKPE